MNPEMIAGQALPPRHEEAEKKRPTELERVNARIAEFEELIQKRGLERLYAAFIFKIKKKIVGFDIDKDYQRQRELKRHLH